MNVFYALEGSKLFILISHDKAEIYLFVCFVGVASSHAEDVLQEKLNVAYKRNEHLTEVCALFHTLLA